MAFKLRLTEKIKERDTGSWSQSISRRAAACMEALRLEKGRV